ncbi:PGF-CTERM sorting domain-containing protein [Euryarchaeota archaeon]|nr:PGF-CTERM sorting domain-containing protein [Euryarchaeota archaeon]
MNRIIVALASLLIVTTPLAGCLDEATLEEIIDDIVGCMDTQAKNYDENATTELVGNCIYAASMDAFFDAMNQEIDIQSMLNQSTTAGYSMSMTMPMGDELGDMGDAMMLVEETVMVNMSANAAHVSMVMSVPMMFSSTTTMIQVGEVVNVHHKLDGMMVTEMGAETIDDKYQTRDMNPNVMEWVIPMLADSMASDVGDGSEDPKDDLTDEGWDMESATISVSFDSSTNAQTMALSTTNETGSIMNLSIKIDESSNLMSYSMVMTNETGSASHVNYAIMWDEAVVITVDQTLPKTAIPVHWDGLPDSNNHEDDDWDNDDDPSVDDMMMMINQDGDSLISWDEFEHFIINEDGGWEDDDDRSETQDHFNYSDDNQDGYLDIDELSNWIESMDDNEEDMWMCDNGEEIPESWVNDGEEDCSDGSDEYDNDNSDDGDHDHDNDDSDNEADMWMCDNGEEIPESWVNDGEEDCSDGSDEYDNDNSDDGDHDHDNDDSDNEPDMWMCDNGEEIPESWVNDGEEDCSDGSDEYDNDDSGNDGWGDEPRDLSLTVANNQTFEAPLSDFSIQFLTCNSDIRSECNVEESASLNSLTGQMGNSTYVYVDTDADGMISAGDTLEITNMAPNFDFDLYDSWSDSYVSDSGVNGPSIPGFGGILATISMLAAAFLLPRRDD